MMRTLVIAAMLVTLSGTAHAETAASLERDGDGRMDKQQYQLAKDLYKLALQRDPKNEFLWVKYDLAHEKYLRAVAHVGKEPPRAHASPATDASPAPAGDDAGGSSDDSSAGTASASASPEAAASPSSEPRAERDPSPSASGGDTKYRSPQELIYLPRPVRSGDTSPVQGAEENGEPIVVRTPQYEISGIEFVVDPAGALHVRGTVKNLSQDRDLRNPSVYVALYDKIGVQIALKPVRMDNVGAVLFRGESGSFDAAFPKFTTTVGAYRVSLDP